MNFFRNAASLLLTSSVTLPVALATSILLARYLSVEDRGLYAVATTLAAVVALIAQLGWPSASIHRLRRARAAPAHVVGAGIVAMIGLSALALLVCAALEPSISHRFLDDAPRSVLVLALAMVPLQLLAGLLGSVARGLDRFRLFNGYTALLEVGILAAMAAVLVVRRGSLIGALAALLVTHAVFTLGLAAGVLRHTGFSLGLLVPEVRASVRFGLKSYAQLLAGQIHERVDLFMLAFLLSDPSQVAFYAIAAGLVQRLKIVPEAIGHAAYPQLAGLEEEDASELACAMSRQSVAWVAATAVPLGGCAPFLIPWFYGSPYAASVLPFAVLLPGMALFTVYRVLSRYFTAIDRQQANIATQIASVAVNVGLNLWWIPQYGILGAAAASLASYALEAVLIMTVFTRSTGRGFRELLIFRREDVRPYQRRLVPLLRWLRGDR